MVPNSASIKVQQSTDLSDKNRENVDTTCHQPVIYDVTVNNSYLWYFPDADLFMPTHSLHSWVIGHVTEYIKSTALTHRVNHTWHEHISQ